MKKMLMVGVLGLGLSGMAGAQGNGSPFGLSKGTTIQQLMKMGAKDEGKGVYSLLKVQKPNSAFSEYMVMASKTHGVCKILALTPDFENDSYGYKTKNAYESLKTALESIYGISQSYDFLTSSSIWDRGNDWMMALKTEDRVLAAFWPAKGAKMSPPFQSISLEANGLSSTKGYISLSYEFDNFSKCKTEINGNPGDNL